MRRREFITLVGATAVAYPLAARAQEQSTGGVRRIGVMASSAASGSITQRWFTEFTKAFERLGWTERRDFRMEYRGAAGNADRARALAKELVSLAPHVLLVAGSPASAAVRQETQTIPIVFVNVTDPVGQGLVANLAHPGGNITGFTDFDSRIGSKWLELLKEIAPGIARAAFIFNPETAPYSGSVLRSIEAAAPSFAVKVAGTPVHDDTEIEHAISAVASEPNGGLIVDADAFAHSHRELITALAALHRLPAVYPFDFYTPNSGGLLFYGIDFDELLRQAAVYVDRILKGAKPSDLPVQNPTKFILVINLKTAKELGLTVPPSLLVQADEVIE
jgi:putative ABC transport system substrate-binding protein